MPNCDGRGAAANHRPAAANSAEAIRGGCIRHRTQVPPCSPPIVRPWGEEWRVIVEACAPDYGWPGGIVP
ncbi:MAG: hypothetical protein FJ291_16640 [Planctomycetes bacterium]|nr:hypothetical protein [Planctomycetota bacterium]